MAANKLEVWNLALTYLDCSKVVSSETEPSLEQGLCTRWYDWARQSVLEEGVWDFASGTMPLALVLDQSNIPVGSQPYPGWRYVYRKPQLCFRIYAVTSAACIARNPQWNFWWSAWSRGLWTQYRPSYQQALDTITQPPGSAINILSNEPNAYAAFVTDVENVQLWSKSLEDCVAYKMAIPMAGPLSASAAAKKFVRDGYTMAKSKAMAQALNQRGEGPYPDSPAISVRV